MRKNRYPILILLRIVLYVLAAFVMSWCLYGLASSVFREGVEIALALGMPFYLAYLGASVVLVFIAEMITLACDIQNNTWQTANQMTIFTKAVLDRQKERKQQRRNPPDGQFQISVD